MFNRLLPRPAILVASLVLLATVLGCTSDDSEPSSNPTTAATTAVTGTTPSRRLPLPPAVALEWSDCTAPFECATLEVPLDYADPDGEQIELALVRRPATDPDARIGSLLINPGGPGASGFEYARLLSFPSEITAAFDIVGFDPRGVGHSTAFVCHSREQIAEYASVEPFPASDEEWQEVIDAAEAFVAPCEERGGDLLPHLGTENVARDMDRIREAVGDEKLTYLGFSYGTSIGAVYADLFPENVRAMVLDGAIDLSLAGDDISLQQAIGFERALADYFEYCRALSCISGGLDPEAAIDELLSRANESPIPAPGADRDAGEGEVLLGILYPMYSEFLWPSLTRAVNEGLAGDGTRLISLTNDYLELASTDINIAVNCLDSEYSRDVEHYKDLAAVMEEAAPHIGRSFAVALLPCAFWPADSVPLSTPEAAGAPPILIIGTTGDPATPYEWAEAMSEQLESGILLTRVGEGHTAYLGNSRCIKDTVDAYLLTLEPPEDGAVCG